MAYRLKTATPCPVDPDGGHLMVDQGDEPASYAHIYRCACGLERLGSTDEARARAESHA